MFYTYTYIYIISFIYMYTYHIIHIYKYTHRSLRVHIYRNIAACNRWYSQTESFIWRSANRRKAKCRWKSTVWKIIGHIPFELFLCTEIPLQWRWKTLSVDNLLLQPAAEWTNCWESKFETHFAYFTLSKLGVKRSASSKLGKKL